MRKIDLIIENIRDEYMINLLEEGTASELESLKTKKFLNESLGRVRNMLIEEGAMDSVKNHLSNNWGKYLAGAGAAGAGALANEYGDLGHVVDATQADIAGNEGNTAKQVGNVLGGINAAVQNTAAGTGEAIAELYNAAGERVNAAGQAIGDAVGNAYDSADRAVGGALPGGVTPSQAETGIDAQTGLSDPAYFANQKNMG